MELAEADAAAEATKTQALQITNDNYDDDA
jgi:hypothetical protein